MKATHRTKMKAVADARKPPVILVDEPNCLAVIALLLFEVVCLLVLRPLVCRMAFPFLLDANG